MVSETVSLSVSKMMSQLPHHWGGETKKVLVGIKQIEERKMSAVNRAKKQTLQTLASQYFRGCYLTLSVCLISCLSISQMKQPFIRK